MSQYRHLTTKEFLSVADHQLDDLTSTDIEKELLRRLTDIALIEDEHTDLIAAFDQYGFDAESAVALMKMVDNHHCGGKVGQVEKKMRCAEELHAIVNGDEEIGTVLQSLTTVSLMSACDVCELQEHADAFTRLAELANNTL